MFTVGLQFRGLGLYREEGMLKTKKGMGLVLFLAGFVFFTSCKECAKEKPTPVAIDTKTEEDKKETPKEEVSEEPRPTTIRTIRTKETEEKTVRIVPGATLNLNRFPQIRKPLPKPSEEQLREMKKLDEEAQLREKRNLEKAKRKKR